MIIRTKKQVAFDVPIKNTDLHCSEQTNGWNVVDTDVGIVEDNWCMVSQDAEQVSEEVKHIIWDEKAVAMGMEESANAGDMLWNRLVIPAVLKKPQNLALLKKPHTVLLLIHLLVGMIVVTSLAWDRYSWRNSALRLENELRQMTDSEFKIEVNEEPLANLEQKGLEQKEAVHFDSMIWGVRSENVLFDNCWASFTLGECTNDAKDNLKVLRSEVSQTVGALAKITWKAALRLQKQATEAAARRFPMALASNYYSSEEMKGIPKSIVAALRSLNASTPEALWNKIFEWTNATTWVEKRNGTTPALNIHRNDAQQNP